MKVGRVKELILLVLLFVSSLGANGNSEMGRTVYKHVFKPELNLIGDDFVSKHTAAQWEELFANDAEGFKKEFGGISPVLDALYKKEKFKELIPHLKEFTVEFASDSGYSPHCHDIE